MTVMLVLGLKAKICGLGHATASPWPWPYKAGLGINRQGH